MLRLSLEIKFNWNGFRNKMQESVIIKTSVGICIIYQAGDLWRDSARCFSLLTVIFPNIHFYCRHIHALSQASSSVSIGQRREERGFKWMWQGCWLPYRLFEYIRKCWSAGIVMHSCLRGLKKRKYTVSGRGLRNMSHCCLGSGENGQVGDRRRGTVTQISWAVWLPSNILSKPPTFFLLVPLRLLWSLMLQ